MTVSLVEKTTSKTMLKIGENKESSLPMDLLRHMHKLAKETHGISDVKTCNGQRTLSRYHPSSIIMYI